MNRDQILIQWKIIEDIQDNRPYLLFGWDGFMPVVIYHC